MVALTACGPSAAEFNALRSAFEAAQESNRAAEGRATAATARVREAEDAATRVATGSLEGLTADQLRRFGVQRIPPPAAAPVQQAAAPFSPQQGNGFGYTGGPAMPVRDLNTGYIPVQQFPTGPVDYALFRGNPQTPDVNAYALRLRVVGGVRGVEIFVIDSAGSHRVCQNTGGMMPSPGTVEVVRSSQRVRPNCVVPIYGEDDFYVVMHQVGTYQVYARAVSPPHPFTGLTGQVGCWQRQVTTGESSTTLDRGFMSQSCPTM